MTQPPPPPGPQQPWPGQPTDHTSPGTPGGQPPQQPWGTQPGHGPTGYAAPGAAAGRPLEGEERTMMLLAHLSAPLAMLLSAGWVPFLGPLLIWLFYKDRSAAVRRASAGAFNFNLTLSLISIGLWISVFLTLGVGFLWAVPGWIALFVIQLWCHIRGAIAAGEGRVYDYPFQLRVLS